MSAPRWNLTDLAGFLGYAESPGIQGLGLLPVALMADYSDAATGEEALARATIGSRIVAVAGRFPSISFIARGRSAILESIRLKPGSATVIMFGGISGVDEGGIVSGIGETFVELQQNSGNGGQLGGVRCTSFARWGTNAAPGPGGFWALSTQQNVVTEIPQNGSLRAFIPAGEALVLAGNVANSQLEFSLVWRELAGRL